MKRKVKFRIFFSAALILTAMLLCVPLLLPSAAYEDGTVSANEPSVSARSAILIEASTADVVWSKNGNEKSHMASTTKIMTALVAIENCAVNETVTVSPDAVGVEGSSIYLYEGERLSMEDLLYAMLLESANDAATAIAIHVGGSIEGFAKLMNDKALELGLRDTHFENPHGLDHPNHYTTAKELAMVAHAAMNNEIFRAIVSTYKKNIPLNETEGVRLLINHNKLLKSYEGCAGIKTGYTKKSGRCLVSFAERDGVEFICVTLNAPDDWQDHSALFDYGFSQYESRLLCSAGEYKRIQSVVGGKDAYVILTNTQDTRITVKKSTGKIESRIYLPRFSYAPVEKGERIGSIIYTSNGKKIAETPITASYSVEKINYKSSFWSWLTALFGISK